MAKESIIASIDIGSSKIRTIVGVLEEDKKVPSIIGVGISPSTGMRKGMVIDVEEAREIEDGEKILAKADDLKIVIELRKITPSLTRIEIRAGGGVVKRDKATASAIVYKTTELAEKLVIQ